jgi:DNA-binding MarR family transcriptional regulator
MGQTVHSALTPGLFPAAPNVDTNFRLIPYWKYSSTAIITRDMNKTPIDKEQVNRLLAYFESLLASASAARDSPDHEISAQEKRAVHSLAKKESAIMTDLAGDLRVPLSTATHIMDRLVRKGLATRLRLDDDRRVVQVHLTTEGKKVEESLLRHQIAIARGMLAPLSSAERELFLELMGKIGSPKQKTSPKG